MEQFAQFIAISTVLMIATAVFLLYSRSPLIALFRQDAVRLALGIIVGVTGGFIIADPEPFLEIVALIFPILLLCLYVTVVLRIKRGLTATELSILAGLVAGGTGYHLARERFGEAVLFATAYGIPLVASVAIHSLLRKHHNAAILTRIRKTKLYQILQTNIRL